LAQTTEIMARGFDRFNFYLIQLNEAFNKARQDKNPALWLLSNNIRTPFFMLQALAKLYAELHNSRLFEKLKDQFKEIEDGLGRIDYHQELIKALENNNNIPEEYRTQLNNQLDESTAYLNQILRKNEWLSEKNTRLNKITKKLQKVDWLNDEAEATKITSFYNNTIDNIYDFVAKTKYHFDDIEHDVHALRRKIRWLSIYAQALQGVLQFSEVEITAPHLNKYLTESIVKSPFNVLPVPGYNTHIIEVQKNYFYSLSWIIAELGNIKDEGLLFTGLSAAIMKSKDCTAEIAESEAYNLLGDKQTKMQDLLNRAETVTQVYFIEDNLRHLLAGFNAKPTDLK
jgi:hypothetical protein